MTKKSINVWLGLSAIMIILSIILLLLPVSTKNHRSAPSFQNHSATADSVSADSISMVTRVIDGDTFVLSDGSYIRLLGVDTPEKGQPFYELAKEYAESTILGIAVAIEFDEEPFDDYGRRLAYLFADSLLYNEEIIKAGLASVYFFKSNRKYASRLIRAQKTARETALGIWSLEPPPAEDYYLGIEGAFRFHRPLCPNLQKSDKSRFKRFATRDDVLDFGLSPCRFCRP